MDQVFEAQTGKTKLKSQSQDLTDETQTTQMTI